MKKVPLVRPLYPAFDLELKYQILFLIMKPAVHGFISHQIGEPNSMTCGGRDIIICCVILETACIFNHVCHGALFIPSRNSLRFIKEQKNKRTSDRRPLVKSRSCWNVKCGFRHWPLCWQLDFLLTFASQISSSSVRMIDSDLFYVAQFEIFHALSALQGVGSF